MDDDDRILHVTAVNDTNLSEAEIEHIKYELMDALPEHRIIVTSDDITVSETPQLSALADEIADRVVEQVAQSDSYDGAHFVLINELELLLESLKTDLADNHIDGGPNYAYALGDCIAMLETIEMLRTELQNHVDQ